MAARHPQQEAGERVITNDGLLYGVDRSDQSEAWAVRSSDGAELWHTRLVLPPGTDTTPAYSSPFTPVVGDGEVYLTLPNYFGDGGALIALRAHDGKELWSHMLNDYFTEVQGEPVAAGDGLVIVPSFGAGISAFHALDGTLVWQSKYPGYYAKLFGGAVYVTTVKGPIVALDERTGAFLWELPYKPDDEAAFSGLGTQLYITGYPQGVQGGEAVYAFDTQQRRLVWTYAESTSLGIPIIATPDLVFIAGVGTHLDAVRARDGTRAWRQEAEEPNAGPTGLVLIDDTLFVRVQRILPHFIILGCGDDCPKSNSLSALRASDGALYWRQYESSDTGSWLGSD